MTVDTPSIRRHVLVAVVAGLAALTAWLALTPSPAQASVRKYKNLATGFCLDSNLAGKAYTHGCNAGAFQRWNVTGGATVVLKNVRTGRCLDSNTRRQVYTLPCNGGNFQRWRVFYNANGTRTFRNVSTKFCLDSNTARRLYTHACNGGSFQKWSLG
jgi:serine/threonine-protein kinase